MLYKISLWTCYSKYKGRHWEFCERNSTNWEGASQTSSDWDGD